jgi:hypothetical protein
MGNSCTGAATVNSEAPLSSVKKQGRKGGVSVQFPLKLHALLDIIEADGLANVISWQPHGRAFAIHNTKEFVETVMPRYFRHTKFSSFRRQLNLYNFLRITQGRDKGAYYHELFLRGKSFLAGGIVRQKVKGTMVKSAASPETEPDLYSMSYVVASPCCPTTSISSPSEDISCLDCTMLSRPFSHLPTRSLAVSIPPTVQVPKPMEYTFSQPSIFALHSDKASFEGMLFHLPSSQSENFCLDEWALDDFSLKLAHSMISCGIIPRAMMRKAHIAAGGCGISNGVHVVTSCRAT